MGRQSTVHWKVLCTLCACNLMDTSLLSVHFLSFTVSELFHKSTILLVNENQPIFISYQETCTSGWIETENILKRSEPSSLNHEYFMRLCTCQVDLRILFPPPSLPYYSSPPPLSTLLLPPLLSSPSPILQLFAMSGVYHQHGTL